MSSPYLRRLPLLIAADQAWQASVASANSTYSGPNFVSSTNWSTYAAALASADTVRAASVAQANSLVEY